MPAIAGWISKRPDRCGEDTCIRDTRITVRGLIVYRRFGMDLDEILRAVQDLQPSDLEAAWEDAAANVGEIDEAIRANESGDEGFVE